MATLVGMLAALTLDYVSSEPCLLERPFELTTQGICATDLAAKPWPLISGYSGSCRDQYMEPPGTNHYRLLAHLAQGMVSACGARAPHICDVGTNHGDSVRAWISGSPSALVSTFDLNDAPQQIAKLQRKRGGPAATQTPEGVREFFGSNVRFFRGNLLEEASPRLVPAAWWRGRERAEGRETPRECSERHGPPPSMEVGTRGGISGKPPDVRH